MTTLTRALNLDQETRQAYGGLRCGVFRNEADLDDVMVVLEWDDPGRARLYALSDDVRRLLAQAGLLGPVHLSILGDAS